MSSLANFVYAPAEVREMDRLAIENAGIAGYTLMSRAGRAAFEVMRQRYPDAIRWLILCGAGNNAGDGFVVARLAQAAQLDVTVATLSDPERLAGDAAQAVAEYQRGGGACVEFVPALLDDADLIVDALLGTGLDRPLSGPYLAAVKAMTRAARPTVALDIPSGLDAGTGAVLGMAVFASVTVTFVGRKLGLYLGAGPDHAGEVVFDDLGIPPATVAGVAPALREFTGDDLVALLPARRATAHKGSFGHVLVVGGHAGMSGAACLAGAAALRSGAGLVSVATQPANVALVTAARPELMCRGVASAQELLPLLERASVIALGPGLGQDDWSRSVFEAVIDHPLPKVVDADALNLLAAMPRQRDDWVLTPHPGEAGRLLGCSTEEVQSDRLAALRALTDRWGGVGLLKGRGSLIAAAGDLPWIVTAGNPGMASAGMGDLLTGIAAGLLAQRPGTVPQTAAAAAFAHATAGDLAARAGERGLIASDLLAELRACLNPGH